MAFETVLQLARCPNTVAPTDMLVMHCIHCLSSSQAVEHTDRLVDVLDQMTDSEKRAWSHDPGLTINETLNELRSPKVHLVVNVKLVGFHGEW